MILSKTQMYDILPCSIIDMGKLSGKEETVQEPREYLSFHPLKSLIPSSNRPAFQSTRSRFSETWLRAKEFRVWLGRYREGGRWIWKGLSFFRSPSFLFDSLVYSIKNKSIGPPLPFIVPYGFSRGKKRLKPSLKFECLKLGITIKLKPSILWIQKHQWSPPTTHYFYCGRGFLARISLISCSCSGVKLRMDDDFRLKVSMRCSIIGQFRGAISDRTRSFWRGMSK